ncbi:MAG: regulatory protein RecX [Actinomycetota bacterium]
MALQEALFPGPDTPVHGAPGRAAGEVGGGPGPAPGELERAMERAGRWLTLRARTESELKSRLLGGGFADEVVDAAVARLRELRLVDDLDFARQWIGQRARRKGLSGEALVAELGAKGVTREIAEAALGEEGLDEDAQALELAARLVGKVAARPLGEQGPRIQQMIVRRGFAPEVAERAARAVLPPDGWD